MAKISWKPGTLVYPVPAALVSCGTVEQGNANVITIAWIGTVCTNPPMLYISVRPERHSYPIIKESGQFTVNLTTVDMVRAVDWCGVRSGRDFNKFAATGLTPVAGVMNDCCMVAESPLSIECRIAEIKKLGSHDMLIADVINVIADDRFIDSKTGYFDLGEARLVSYCHGKYYGPGELLGHFGFSVKKPTKKKKKRTKTAK